MKGHLLAVAVVAAALALGLPACNGLTSGSDVDGASGGPSSDDSFADIVGQYRWRGTRLFFQPGLTQFFGDFAGLVPSSVNTDLVARLFVEEGELFLGAPFCAKIPLRRDGSILRAENVDCPLTEDSKLVGTERLTLRALKVDLDARRLHAYREDVGALSGHTTSDDSFVRLSAPPATGAMLPPPTSRDSYSDAEEGYRFEGVGRTATCETVVGADCADVGLRVRRQGLYGNVYRLRDGRYYIEGYDCYAEQGYEGPPIECGKSLTEFSRGEIPEVWMTRFSLENDQLRFDAELRLGERKVFVILETPVEKF